MKTDHQYFQYLLKRYADHQISWEEYELLLAYVSEHGIDEALESVIDKDWESLEMDFPMADLRSEGLYRRITATIKFDGSNRKAKNIRLWPGIAGVAAAVAVIVFGVWFYTSRQAVINRNPEIVRQNDIAPGKAGATLTLANGKKINLTNAANGEIAKEAGMSVTKAVDGQLIYEIKKTTGGPDKINTLTTAKGETYILTLPDKSKVWMNAASSLTYATALNKHGERRVKLSGEAYFEITKDKAHPFVVESSNQQVEVLGTHFNVSAYDDDQKSKTTLLEGSVRVTLPHAHGEGIAGFQSVVLKPNQQSVLSGSDRITIEEVNPISAIDWKNGEFRFKNEPLTAILKKVSRWYDVEIVYEGKQKELTFTGSVSRFNHVSVVLGMLEKAGDVQFTITGKTIKVKQL